LVPRFSFNYKIINPYFDEYDKHIELENEMFYRAKDFYKGYNTIEMFDLWNPIYNNKWAVANAIGRKEKRERVAFRISDPNINEAEKNHLINYAQKLVQRFAN
ncbi:MAG: hypothetical protein ACOVO1_10165, partial [Chitinophagaceae bacterium]